VNDSHDNPDDLDRAMIIIFNQTDVKYYIRITVFFAKPVFNIAAGEGVLHI
jgi:hypothetical protein